MARKKKTAAALTAVSMVRLLTWQSAPSHPHRSLMYTLLTSTPPHHLPNLAFTWVQVRSGERAVSVFITGIGHIWGEWFADCLSSSCELTGLMNSAFPPLTSLRRAARLPVCLSVCLRHRFWSHFYVWLCLSFCLSPLQSLFPAINTLLPPAPVSMCWSLFLLSEVAGKDLISSGWHRFEESRQSSKLETGTKTDKSSKKRASAGFGSGSLRQLVRTLEGEGGWM